MGKRRKLIEQAMYKNTITYEKYVQRLVDISVSLFEWKNLPESIDPRFIEVQLFEGGSIAFFEDEVMGLLALPWVQKGSWDVYGNPIVYDAYSRYRSYNKTINNQNSVVVWNNHLKTNSIDQINAYAERLALIDRIMDVNINSQKTPVIIKGTENQRLTIMNLYEQWDGNVPFIFGDKGLEMNELKALTANSPFISDKLIDIKAKIWNEALTFLGVSNVTFEKSQQMLQDEVTRMLGGTFASRNSRVMARKQGVEKINKMFGTNIEVNFSDGIPDEIKNMGGKGINNEQIYDGSSIYL